MNRMKIAGISLIVFGVGLIAAALVMHFGAEKRSNDLVQAYMDYANELASVAEQTEPVSEGATQENAVIEPSPEAVTIPEGVMGVMLIDKIDLVAPIVEGTNMKSIQYALGHFKDTALPGETGNFAVAGHRSYTFGEYFSRLDEVTSGDVIEVMYGTNTYKYAVNKSYVVEPEQMEVLDPTEDPAITLVTCTPKWTATHRLIVRGYLMEDEDE